ncbi:MAG: HAD-IIIA family hydrolase [Gemmatimonadales bacterium]|nr:MAG: HAD-IIIA family hydrolase [Gemmatimonadales bacterium]
MSVPPRAEEPTHPGPPPLRLLHRSCHGGGGTRRGSVADRCRGRSLPVTFLRRKQSAPATGAVVQPVSPPHASVGRRERLSGRERIPHALAQRIRLVVLDVDGVLTDGGVYLGETGEGSPVELKRFHIQDGLGIRFLRQAGIQVALLSGRPSPATRLRAEEWGLDECIQTEAGVKMPAMQALMRRMEVTWDEVAMLGDDLPDLPILRKVAIPAAVGNAVTEVRREVLFTTRREGGQGAVREFARLLLEARGEWESLVNAYCTERSEE